jgi:hypothetical protein
MYFLTQLWNFKFSDQKLDRVWLKDKLAEKEMCFKNRNNSKHYRSPKQQTLHLTRAVLL